MPTGGLALDLCRTIAVAIAGPHARIAFHVYESADDFDAIRRDADDVAFLSGEEAAENNLSAAILPGPPVFFEQIALLAPEAAPTQRPADLAGAVVCFMIGDRAQQAVEAAMADLRPPVARLAFREDVEMLDAFNAQRCDAMAGEATTLAAYRHGNATNQRPSRLLTEPLAIYPVFAATPRADGAWAADVAWVIAAVIAAGQAPSPWVGAWSAQTEGLLPDWRAAVPGYGALYDRNFRALGLPAGPNRVWPAGLFVP